MKTPSWQNRPVFISSTFRDMQAERDYLRDFVFPELSERLRATRQHIEPIDLRWGVDTSSFSDEEGSEKHVLKVCLNEINRSRPFLIVLLGDRYGWVPPEKRTETAIEEHNSKLVSDEDSENCFDTEIRDKSVTSLEIEYGVLKSPSQQVRSFFYFRNPLPYDQMPDELAGIYSDEYGSNKEACADNHRKLLSLKEQILRTVGEDRIRKYDVTWNPREDRIERDSLKEFGDRVLEDIWEELSSNADDGSSSETRSWLDEEQSVLEEFIEDRSRCFTGRASDIDSGTGFALSDACESKKKLFLNGASGSGKSSLFAVIKRRLDEHEDCLVLPHAAGISYRSTDLEILLKNWISILSQEIEQSIDVDGIISFDELKSTFADLLSIACTRTRVVAIIDAVDQFSNPAIAVNLTWLPGSLPENFRLIATNSPSESDFSPIDKSDIEDIHLSRICEEDALFIIDSICRRHHKELPELVVRELMNKVTKENEHSYGNPLWLSLAIQQLVLIDEDDFDRAEKFEGSAGEKLLAMMVDLVRSMPASVDLAYASIIERAASNFGEDFVAAVVEFIAVSRFGLRKQDLSELVTGHTGGKWEEIRFSILRRFFDVHLIESGDQWNFRHVQFRRCLFNSRLRDERYHRQLHRALALHIESLPADDPFRQSEILYHYIKADMRKEAAHYLCGSLSEAEKSGAARVLSSLINREFPGEEKYLCWFADLIRDNSANGGKRLNLFGFVLSDLMDAMENSAIELKSELLEINLEELRQAAEGNDDYEHIRHLTINYQRVGHLKWLSGDTAETLRFYGESLNACDNYIERVKAGTRELTWEYIKIIVGNYLYVGEFFNETGELENALRNYKKALDLVDATGLQEGPAIQFVGINYCEFAEIYEKFGDSHNALEAFGKSFAVLNSLRDQYSEADAEYDIAQNALSVCCKKYGIFLTNHDELKNAEVLFQLSLSIDESRFNEKPDDSSRIKNLGSSYNNLYILHKSRGDYDQAWDDCQRAYQFTKKFNQLVPDNMEYACDLAISVRNMSDIKQSMGDNESALQYLKDSVELLERITRISPDVVKYQAVLSETYLQIGALYLRTGPVQKVLEYYNEAYSLHQGICAQYPNNILYAIALSDIYYRFGEYYQTLEDLNKALGNFEDCRQSRMEILQHSPETLAYAYNLSLAYLATGEVHLQLKNEDKAIEEFNSANELNRILSIREQSNYDYLKCYIFSSFKLGACELAKRNMKVSARLSDPDKFPNLQKARSLLEGLTAGNLPLDEGLRNIKNILDRMFEGSSNGEKESGQYDERAVLLFKEGIRLTKEKNLSAALKSFFEALSIEPDYVEVMVNIGTVYEMGHDFDSAVEYFKKAIEVLPEFSLAWVKLGTSLFNLGRYEESYGILENLLSRNPNEKAALYIAGLCQSKMKNTEAAIDFMRKAAFLGHPQAVSLCEQNGIPYS